MDKNLLEKAKSLSKRGFTTNLYRDKTTDGIEIFLAKCPELDGCMAQGKTIEEAFENVANSREDFIYFLLEDDLPVPEPSNTQTEAVKDSFTNVVIDTYTEKSNFKTTTPKSLDKVFEGVIEPEFREPLYSTSFKT